MEERAFVEQGASGGDLGNLRPDEAILDINAIGQLCGRTWKGETLYAYLFRRYCEEAPVLLKSIEISVAKRDCDELYESAHALKGASAVIGARHVREICDNVARLAQADGLCDDKLVSELRAAVSVFEAEARRVAQANEVEE